jgi:hypothetical protein
MRRQDFIESKMEGIKFRVSFPDEVVATVECIDNFAIGFADWFCKNCYEDQIGYYTASELLETYKKENGVNGL